jgi:hypothetical protein
MAIIYLVKKFNTLIKRGIPSTRSKSQPGVNVSQIKPINFSIIVSILQLVGGYQQLFTTLCRIRKTTVHYSVQNPYNRSLLCEEYVKQPFTTLCRIRTTIVHYSVQNTYNSCSLLCAEYVQQPFTTRSRIRTTTVHYSEQNTYNKRSLLCAEPVQPFTTLQNTYNNRSLLCAEYVQHVLLQPSIPSAPPTF